MQTVTIKPPDALLAECRKPEVSTLKSNEDLIDLASIALMYLEQCAAKVDAIRQFYEDKETSNESD